MMHYNHCNDDDIKELDPIISNIINDDDDDADSIEMINDNFKIGSNLTSHTIEELKPPSIAHHNTPQTKPVPRSPMLPSSKTIHTLPSIAQKTPTTLTLYRICVISTFLSIAFCIHFVCELHHKPEPFPSAKVWKLIYVSSSIWLFIACIIMIMITLFGIKIKLFALYHRQIAIWLFGVGIIANIVSFIISALFNHNNNNKRFLSKVQLFYILQTVHLSFLIYWFNDRLHHFQIINIILFSITLFLPTFVSFVSSLFVYFSSYNGVIDIITNQVFISSAIFCIATSILITFHILCLYKHYNSGLFLKLLIMASLSPYLSVNIRGKDVFVDFDNNQYLFDKYRIYYYYILLTISCILYCFELFVEGSKRIVSIDAKSVARSLSFDFDVEIGAMDLYNLQTQTENIDDVCGVIDTLKNKFRDMSKVDNNTTFYETDNSEKVSLKRKLSKSSKLSNPNENIESVIQIFPDFKPTLKNANKYFNQLNVMNDVIKHKNIDRLTDSIAAIVPFYNEKAHEIHATLRSLYFNFEYIKKKRSQYKFTQFNVLLIGDGWFKADISTKRYLAKLYNGLTHFDDEFMNFKQENHKHNTIILQTKFNKKLCINPFNNDQKKLYLKVTTIIKIDNRKKANSHEWFLGRYGFAEWCKCDYMFFTDAYSTLNEEGLYKMVMHMKKPKNQDVVCCTGRARVYTIDQELDLQNLLREKYRHNTLLNEDDDDNNSDPEDVRNKVVDNELIIDDKWWNNDIFFNDDENKKQDIMANTDVIDNGDNVFYNIQDIDSDHRLTMNAHLRSCQMFEFEALYGTIGCYLLGSFLPVIPGPCGLYRSSYLLPDQVRGWYFEKINKKNDPLNIDLVLGNMKLAEDRILTISSILNNSHPVRHVLIPECIFYFDPMPSLTQLMKQRRRWINGSIATVIFVLRKVSFTRWNVSIFRRYYVLSTWYMQLFMYVVVALSPPLIFTISFTYGLATILNELLLSSSSYSSSIHSEIQIRNIVGICVALSWIMFIVYIYYVQGGGKTKLDKYIKKATIIKLTLFISFSFGLLTLSGTFIQIFKIIKFKKNILSTEGFTEEIVESSFNFAVILVEITFFAQSFILAPLVSKDIKTLTIMLQTCFYYFLYSPFYVTFFFINAIANVHDLSWGTRPAAAADNIDDNNKVANNENVNDPKQTTLKLLLIIVSMDIVIAMIINPFTNHLYAHIIFFVILAFPSLYQIFFSLLWLIKTRLFNFIFESCRPKKLIDDIEYLL